jgi:beta-lactamase superfamily II metal-dependent hydrolase
MLGRNDVGAVNEALVAVRERANRPDAKVLLVVDQFEELLGTEEGVPFLAQLREVAQHKDAPAVILGTMRSDFLDRFQRSAPLLDLRYEVMSLGPMSESDIKEIIEEPAKEKDVELEESLVAALVKDAGTQNTLPLLAFTLRELWERFSNDGRLTLEEYRDELGGVQKVVGVAADNVMKSARVTREQEPALRAAFLAMMRVTDDGKYARRTVKWSDLPETIHPLLERFVAARLLVSGNEGTEDTIEVAHERLFDSWEQLRGWINEDLEAIRLRADVESAAHTWDGSKTRDLLWRGARVSRARELLTAGKLLLDDVGRRFIDASHRAERVWRRVVIGVVSAFAIVAGTLAVIALISAQNAKSSALRAADDAKVAEIQRLRARSAQSFAEHQRVRTRAQTSVSEDEKRALEAIAPKYLEQSKRFEADAIGLEKRLDEWRRTNGIQTAPPATLFTFEVLRAKGGNSFLVHYGSPNSARHVLIDGGVSETYRDVLKPRLGALRTDGKAVELSLVVASQTDNEHIEGLISLIKDLQQQSSSNPDLKINTLWSNGFVPGPPDKVEKLLTLQRKGRLVAGAKALQVPVNKPFTRMIAAPEAGAARVRLEDQLTVTVLSPRVQWLRQFADDWLKDWRERVEKLNDPELLASLNDYDILETFTDPAIELLPSPIEPPELETTEPQRGTYRDQSAVNLGSTVLMLELNGKRILLTADAREDVIMSALAQAGYTDDKGNTEVDVLVLPHGGSDSNVSVDFFRKVKARHYVMSANGSLRHPRVRTFEMLFEARRGDARPFSIGLTYAPEEYKTLPIETKKYPFEELCALLAHEKNAGTPFEIVTPKKDQGSFGIDLLIDAPFVDKGNRNAVCN